MRSSLHSLRARIGLVVVFGAVGAIGCATASDDLSTSSGDSAVPIDSGTHAGDTSVDSTRDGTVDVPTDGPCLAPKKVCSGVCTDITSDNKNCGDCGKSCGDTA